MLIHISPAASSATQTPNTAWSFPETSERGKPSRLFTFLFTSKELALTFLAWGLSGKDKSQVLIAQGLSFHFLDRRPKNLIAMFYKRYQEATGLLSEERTRI